MCMTTHEGKPQKKDRSRGFFPTKKGSIREKLRCGKPRLTQLSTYVKERSDTFSHMDTTYSIT